MNTLNRAAIKAMHDEGASPLDCLKAAIEGGREYPAAVWLVTDALKLQDLEVEEMEQQY
jgi:hypothetical protein